jgi:hypothetical protein
LTTKPVEAKISFIMAQKILSWLWKCLDVPGGAVLGMFSLGMLSLCIFSVVAGKDVPVTIATIYGLALTNYSIHKTVKVMKHGAD